MSRGNEKQNIFLNRSDRLIFLQILEKVTREHDWECYAYCLMNNHYHLALSTPLPNLAPGMRYMNGVYCQSFNVRHERVGHLLQGRYSSRVVERDSYLLALARYLVQNPVRAKLCDRVENWEWSSFRATAGLSDCPEFLRTDLILELFASDPGAARSAYHEFVSTPAETEPWMKFEPVRTSWPDSSGREDLASILANNTPKEMRDLQIFDAYVNHGYNMREIAEFLECHASTISKIISAVRGKSNSHQGV